MWHKSMYDTASTQDAGTAGSALRFASDDGAEILVIRFGREHQMTLTYRRGGISVDLAGSQCDAYGEAPSRILTILLPFPADTLEESQRRHLDSATFRRQLKADLVAAFSDTPFSADFPLIDNVVFYQELPDNDSRESPAESVAAVL